MKYVLCAFAVGLIAVGLNVFVALSNVYVTEGYLYGREVPCVKEPGEMCRQKKECALNCGICKEGDDKCCCLHVDRCTCIDPSRGEACCE